MPDEMETIWRAEPHTFAKHGILKSYLDAWAAILSVPHVSKSLELLFVDGFAGPGEYSGGEPGSPIVALNAILNHTRDLQKPVRFLFIENRLDRFNHLRARLAREQLRTASNSRVIIDEPRHGECDTELRHFIDSRTRQGRPLGPALFFLDQFGYSQVPMTLIREIMRHEQCEAFSYLNCQRMNNFLEDETKWPGITAAYGDETWRDALDLRGEPRQTRLIESYKAAIRRNAGVKYVWSFAMFDRHGHLIHWLIFSTKHLRGLEEMKRAMWKADKAGDYRFSDRVGPSQQVNFFTMLHDDWLADEIARRLVGRTISEPALKEWVLTETPFHLYKKSVGLLRTSGRATPREKSAWPITFSTQAGLDI